jgi:hypothetical protein
MATEKIIKVPIIDKNSKKKLIIVEYNNGKFTRKDIEKKVKTFSKEMKEKGKKGELKTMLHYGPKYAFPWYGAKWTQFGKQISLFNLIDYDDYELLEPKYFDSYKIIVRNTN